MNDPISSSVTSRPRRRRFRLTVRGLLGLVLGLGLLFAWLARDDRNPFEKLRDDWSRSENSYWDALNSAKSDAARQQVAAGLRPDPDAFARRCLDLARSQPGTPSALASLCWAVGNSPNSASGREAAALLMDGRLDRVAPLALMKALEGARTTQAVRPNPLAPYVLEAAKRHLDDPQAAGLLTWVCANQFGDRSAEEPPAYYQEAADLIVARFAASPDISNFCETLGIGSGSPPWAPRYEKHLRTILEQNRTRLVRCTASFALASVVQSTGETRQDEAERLYQRFLKDFDASDPSTKHVEENMIASGRREAAGIRTRGLGKPAPGLDGFDLQGRPMDLAELRGKVVLVSFWATWCGPCMQMIPHEKAILERFSDRPFAIVGVNGDNEPEGLSKALATPGVTWRSLRDARPGRKFLSDEWKVGGWPTLYLVDQKGIIRKQWVGSPGDEVLTLEIGQLLDATPQPR